MHKVLLLVALFALLPVAGARADVRTFSFSGTVDNDPFGVFGDAAFTGEFSFDTAIAQVLDTPQSGGYAGAGGVYGMHVSFAGVLDPAVAGPFTADALNITVNNDFPGPMDQYLVTGTSSVAPFLQIGLALSDFTGSAFAATALPLVPPSLGAFQSLRFELFAGTLDSPIEAEGTLATLRCAAGCTVPEPAAPLLMAVALAAAALSRRRAAVFMSTPRRKLVRTMRWMRFMAAGAWLGAVALPAHAVDGVILVDQNKAMSGSVTVGDTPGFPVSINQPGSYRLGGNLSVPNNTTTAIEINASNVTLDLNGFAILGPVTCPAFPCTNAGSLASGYGVLSGSDSPQKAYVNITVRNGTIAGMGADGVHILGDSVRVEDLRVHDNAFSGIVVRSTTFGAQTNLLVRGNNVQRNGSYGVKTYAGLVIDNMISESRDAGISVQADGGAMVARNLVTGSGLAGLSLTAPVGYYGNTLVGNNGGGAQVLGGVNLGQNACGAAACP